MTLRPHLLYLLLPLSLVATAFQPLPQRLQALDRPVSRGDCDPTGLCLQITVGLSDPANPQACASSNSVTAEVGQSLTWCYTLTNNSGQTLNWHNLQDDLHGSVFSQLNQPVTSGSTHQYVRVRSAGSVHNAAVNATWTASVERPSYQHDDSVNFDYIDATDGQVAQMVGGFPGTRTAPVTLPFNFTYFGVTSNQLCVGHNGAAEFGVGSCVLPMVFGLPAVYGAAVIAPAWTELVDSVGTVHTKTIGSSPGSRKFVVQWSQVSLAWPSVVPGLDFQLVLEEGSNTLTFQYAAMGANGSNGERSVVGLQPDRMSALNYSTFQQTLPAGRAIRWTPILPTAVTATASAQLDVGAAQLLLPIPQLTGFTGVGVVTSQPLVLINTGNRALSWSAGEYPARHLEIVAAPGASRASTRTAHPRRPQSGSGPVTRSTARLPSGLAAVPSWGLERIVGAQRDYVSLDLLNPSAPSTVLSNFHLTSSASGMDFVGNDFSQQWVIDWRNNNVHTVNPGNGSAQLVGQAFPGNVVPGEGWMGMAWDPASDQLYAVSVSEACGWSGLYRIDRASAAASFVGAIVTGANVCITDIAFDQNGQLYGVDISEDALVLIDKTNGISQLVGELGFDAEFEQGLKFDRASGTLYWTAFVDEQGAVASIDPLTGTPTLLAPTREFHQLMPFSIATAGGDCSQPSDIPWLQLDLVSGELQPGSAPAFINVEFNASQLSAGVYEASICIFNNDPAYRVAPARVPVRLTVQAETPIFASGFED